MVPVPGISMQIQEIRLGVASARSAYADNSGIWVDAGLGRLVDIWAPACREFSLALSHAPKRMPFHDHRLNIDRRQFFPMPWMPSVSRAFHKAHGCRRAIREIEQRSDVLIVQLPFAASLGLLGARTPRVYHLCADIREVSRTSSHYSGFKRLPAVTFGTLIDALQRRLFRGRDVRVVTNGEPLYQHYGCPPGRSVVSATIRESEILSVPRRRPAGAPFQILYVGFLRHEKGIDTLLDAYEQLLGQIPDAELVIAGGRNMVDRGMSEMIDRRVQKLNTKGNVKLLGQVDFGPDLFQCFADADVLALPSRSEGTPRVLIEARAFACPVIGTSVGGIPSSITHEVDGLLIPPDNSIALCESLLRIARDAELKRHLVAAGLERVRASTMENYARVIAEQVALLFEQSRHGEQVLSTQHHLAG